MSVRDVARAVEVPERTVHHWCRRTRRTGAQRRPDTSACPLCTEGELRRERYAYLLGMYLGDGHITTASRTCCLWIYCANDWPGILREVRSAVGTVLPSSRVSTVQRTGCVAVKSYSKHWTCLFPQHGPGMKHSRRIVLEPWQEDVVATHPGPFLRGLFHSDGCRITNWARQTVNGAAKRYEYPRWLFSNTSADILDLCTAALDRLGVAHRRPRPDIVSVARRDAVEVMDRVIGPKT